MYCPLIEEEIAAKEDKCPTRCMYRHKTGVCKYNELSHAESLSIEEIAEILEVSVQEVREQATKGVKRIQVALAIDAYIAYVNGHTVSDHTVNSVSGKFQPVFRLLNFAPNQVRKLFNKDRYEKWQTMSKVDITYKEVVALFGPVLNLKEV
jgi:hypothetical protein